VKLNLGCGHERLSGWLNVDKFGDPDLRVDLEQFPWPWSDSSVDEVRLHHVLEHLGQATETYLGVWRELYRVCSDGALLHITVPHPRHDDYLTDPTHVRPILAESFQLLSKKKCLDWKSRGVSNTPLALYLGVDFEVERVSHSLDPLWHAQLEAGKLKAQELSVMAQQINNVIKQTDVELRVLKPA
jgi:hypothetical protein